MTVEEEKFLFYLRLRLSGPQLFADLVADISLDEGGRGAFIYLYSRKIDRSFDRQTMVGELYQWKQMLTSSVRSFDLWSSDAAEKFLLTTQRCQPIGIEHLLGFGEQNEHSHGVNEAHRHPNDRRHDRQRLSTYFFETLRCQHRHFRHDRHRGHSRTFAQGKTFSSMLLSRMIVASLTRCRCV